MLGVWLNDGGLSWNERKALEAGRVKKEKDVFLYHQNIHEIFR